MISPMNRAATNVDMIQLLHHHEGHLGPELTLTWSKGNTHGGAVEKTRCIFKKGTD